MDNDKRSKDVIKQNAKSRFLTKEYSRPVQSANDLAYRKRQKILDDINEDIRVYTSKYIRERGNMEYFRRKLAIISINFDATKFKPSKSNRLNNVFSNSYGNANKIVESLPSDCALDFGPGNQMLVFTKKSKPMYASSMRQSNTGSKHDKKWHGSKASQPRPHTTNSNGRLRFKGALPTSNHTEQDHEEQSRSLHSTRFHGNTRSQNGITCSFSTAKRGKSAIPLCSKLGNADEDDDEDDDEEIFAKGSDELNADGDVINGLFVEGKQNLKSFHSLRREHTYAPGELPDDYKDRLNLLKNLEKRTFTKLQSRIKKFYTDIKPLHRVQSIDLTIVT